MEARIAFRVFNRWPSIFMSPQTVIPTKPRTMLSSLGFNISVARKARESCRQYVPEGQGLGTAGFDGRPVCVDVTGTPRTTGTLERAALAGD